MHEKKRHGVKSTWGFRGGEKTITQQKIDWHLKRDNP